MSTREAEITTEPHLMLTPAGVLHAFADPDPPAECASLQLLMAHHSAPLRSDWLALDPNHEELLSRALENSWVEALHHPVTAPQMRLDDFLSHAIAGLSGSRTVALATGDGFCIARVGYSQQQADVLCAAAADFLDYARRQQSRGLKNATLGRAISIFNDIDLLLPATSFIPFWIDGSAWWLVIDGEPLINNTALVQLLWNIRLSGSKFTPESLR
ncbi:MAG TPA: hypothetical protein VK036_03025 [Wenzhouxiangella sp.]|nr:hypothetical protein [Wenzhouxiangella sp.]